MNDADAQTQSVVVERDFRCSPGLLWRALTEPQLIAEWLMQNDFAPTPGHRFTLSAEWGTVECEVQEVQPGRVLRYRWDTKDLRSVVTWTLTPARSGTRLRMEQVGFQPGQRPYLQGARAGWPRFLSALEHVVARLEGEGT